VSMLYVDIRALEEHKQGKRDAHGWGSRKEQSRKESKVGKREQTMLVDKQ